MELVYVSILRCLDHDCATDNSTDTGGEDGTGRSVDITATDFASSAEGAAAEYGGFEAFTASGSAEEVIELPAEIDSGIITVECTESFLASLDVLDAAGEYFYAIDLDYQEEDPMRRVGIFMTDVKDDDERVSSIRMPEDEGWRVAIEPISALPTMPDTFETPGIFLYDGPAGDFTFDGDIDRLAVSQKVPGEVLAVTDKPGAPATLVEGPSIVEVIADAPWTITPA